MNNGRTALLVMDVQKDFMPDGRMPVDPAQAGTMLAQANEAICVAEAQGIPVVYIVNEFRPWDIIANLFRRHAAIRGSAGAALDDRLRRTKGPIFAKHRASAFTNPLLVAFLQEKQIQHVILTGVYAEGCVYRTAVDAAGRGYQVSLLKNGTAGKNDRVRSKVVQTMQEKRIASEIGIDDMS